MLAEHSVSDSIDLSALLLARGDVRRLVPEIALLKHSLRALGVTFEIIVAGGNDLGDAKRQLDEMGVRYVRVHSARYGMAMRRGVRLAQGRYVLTMDEDFFCHLGAIEAMWRRRNEAAVVIASRFAPGSKTAMPGVRKFFSRLLNRVTAKLLSVPVRDLSSGYRLIHRDVFRQYPPQAPGYDVLLETVVQAYAAGWRVAEVPMMYVPRGRVPRRQPWAVAWALVRTIVRYWRLRNSIDSADYDERAFFSAIPLQRFWHRRRHQVILDMALGKGLTLDVGCGSSVILPSLGQVVGLDVSLPKLRFARKWGLPLVQGSANRLPFADEAFDCVICSQVVEHMPIDRQPLGELVRVLKTGGTLVVGTPDYATAAWRMIEPLYGKFAPGGYRDEHITHYTGASLARVLEWLGCRVEDARYTFGELNLAATKVGAAERRLDEVALREAGVETIDTGGTRPDRSTGSGQEGRG